MIRVPVVVRLVGVAGALIVAVVVARPVTTAAQRPASAPKPASAGNGLMYLSTYKGVIQVYDEATEKQIAEIPVKTGIPGDVTFSDDRTKLYIQDVSYEKVEIIDRVKKTTIDSFTLTEDKAKTRIWGLQPDPHDKYLILVIKKYTLHPDRWEIGPPTLVQYDLATKKIARTIPWPKGEEREGAGVLFSPDGKVGSPGTELEFAL